MYTIKKPLFYILLFLLIPTLCFGAAHYVDTTAADETGDGTFGDPFKTIAQVNAHSFASGEDVYFKVGQTWTPTAKLTIDWTGASGAGNDVTIGAWEAENDFDITGQTKPIIDGNSQAVPSVAGGLIQVSNASYDYITIQDLRVFESGWYGINIKYSDHVTVQRCLVSYSEKSAIAAFQSSYTTYDENIITQNCQINNPSHTEVMGAILIAAQAQNDTDATITQNKVYNNWCTENIGINRGIVGGLVEKNVLYDNQGTPGIYLDYVKDIVVRYNLLYRTNDATFDGMVYGISMNAEPYGYWHGCYHSGHEIYGNMLAAFEYAINLGGQECRPDDMLIYNNTLVDSVGTNIKIWSNGAGGSGNEIKNNISWILSGGGAHISTCSPAGYTFDYNLWDSDPGTGDCDAANDPANASPELVGVPDWQDLTADGVTGDEFVPSSGSPVIDAGATLNQLYDDGLNDATDFTDTPPTIVTSDQDNFGSDATPWEIGAYVFSGAEDPPQPTMTKTTDTPIVCPNGQDPLNVTFSFTTDVNAYGRISDTEETWDTMTSSKAMDTGAGTQTHSHVVSLACGQTISYWLTTSTEVGDNGSEATTVEHEVVIGAEQAPAESYPVVLYNDSSGGATTTLYNDSSGGATVTLY